MADTSASAIMTKRQPETGSSLGGTFPEVGAISGSLPTGGVIRNFQNPALVPETDGSSLDPRAIIQKAINNQGSAGISGTEELFSQATGKPLQK